MKIPRALFCFALLGAWASQLLGQTADVPPEATAPGITQINSDALEMDQARLTCVFTGKVAVTGNNFNLTCDDMTIFFTSSSKVNTIVAHGHVIINQPGLVAHCGRAQYFHAEDKFVLTDQPDVVKNSTEVTAPIITVWRATQMMNTDGPTRTRFIPTRP